MSETVGSVRLTWTNFQEGAMSAKRRAPGWGGRRAGAGRPKSSLDLILARNTRRARAALRAKTGHGIRLEELLRLRLRDLPLPEDVGDFDAFLYYYLPEGRLASAWEAERRAVLKEWSASRPGSRPSCWWLFDAPRLPAEFIVRYPAWGPWVLKRFHAPRLMVGGSGRRVEHDPYVEEGFPMLWIAVDATDPPRFESQAAYLLRHRLLSPGEAKRLREPDHQPELLPTEYWPNQKEIV